MWILILFLQTLDSLNVFFKKNLFFVRIHRYKELIAALEFPSVRQFELEIGVKESTISQAINRHSSVSRNVADKILTRFPHVNRDWLLTGQGEMFTTDTINEPPAEYGAPAESTSFFAWLLRQHDEYIKTRTLFTAEELEKMARQRRKIEELKKKLDDTE